MEGRSQAPDDRAGRKQKPGETHRARSLAHRIVERSRPDEGRKERERAETPPFTGTHAPQIEGTMGGMKARGRRSDIRRAGRARRREACQARTGLVLTMICRRSVRRPLSVAPGLEPNGTDPVKVYWPVQKRSSRK